MTSDQELKSLKRGLRILIMLTRNRSMTISEAARALDLPRSTAERIIVTLETENFVERDAQSKRYSLAPRVMAFACASSAEDQLVRAAKPMLFAKTRKIGWPLAISVAQGEHMTLCVTTDSATSLGIHKRHVGAEVDMARCSSGIVHMAFMEEAEQQATITLLAHSESPLQCQAVSDRVALQARLQRARRDGYVIGTDWPERAVSVPLRESGRVRAVLVMIYLARCVSDAIIQHEFVPQLKALAASIEAAAFPLGNAQPVRSDSSHEPHTFDLPAVRTSGSN